MGGRKEEKKKEEEETKGKKERKITNDTQWWLSSCGFPEAPRGLFYLNIYLFLIYLPYVCRVQKSIRWPGLEFRVVVSCLIGCELWFSGGTASAPTPWAVSAALTLSVLTLLVAFYVPSVSQPGLGEVLKG